MTEQKSQSNPKPSFWHINKLVIVSILKASFVTAFSLCVLILIGLVIYGSTINNSVRAKFEGKRWNIPAVAYARPLELYAGKIIKLSDLESELKLLGYRQVKTVAGPGTYRINSNSIELISRKFNFSDGIEPSKHIVINFNPNSIEIILNNTGVEETLVRLDPMQMGTFYAGEGEDRALIKLSEIPKIIPQVLISVEDKDFYSHFGLNPIGIARAFVANLKAGKFIQGGSTITQQLAKNFYLSSKRTITRKIKEAVTAVILELHYQKDEILEVYLNEVFFAQNGQRKIHGIALASQFFYGIPAKELNIAQAASLVGALKATTFYNPRRNPSNARNRTNLILDMLVADNVISHEIAEIEKNRQLTTIDIKDFGQTNTKYPGFMDMVKKQLLEDYSKDELQNDGIKVFTTFNPVAHNQLNSSINSTIPSLEQSVQLPEHSLQTALVLVNIKSGEVEAIIGDRNTRLAGFNRAINAKRPIGSLIKPIIYLSALEQPELFTLATLLSGSILELEFEGERWVPKEVSGSSYDELLNIEAILQPDGTKADESFNPVWQPKNYSEKENEDALLINALAHSYNLSTVRLGVDVGLKRIIKRINDLGYKGRIRPLPSILLGSINMSPFEIAQLYLSLANRGFFMPLRTIKSVVNQDGVTLNRYSITTNKILEENVAFLNTVAMRRVVTHGTARKINKFFPEDLNLIGKTGTTNDFRDSWFAGFSGNYLTISWIGRDNNEVTNLSGSRGALELWINVMRKLNLSSYNLRPTHDIVYKDIHSKTGKLTDPDCEYAIRLPFVEGSEPAQFSNCLAEEEVLQPF